MESLHDALARVAQADLGVAQNYRHSAKHITPREPIATAHAVLKWYDVHRSDQPVPADAHELARQHLAAGAIRAGGLGFVVLHRCGEAFYFLMVCTWRGENELWETVHHKLDDTMDHFALWPRTGEHVPTYCVWELGAVEFERHAWRRFLESGRDAAARDRWFAERYHGPA